MGVVWCGSDEYTIDRPVALSASIIAWNLPYEFRLTSPQLSYLQSIRSQQYMFRELTRHLTIKSNTRVAEGATILQVIHASFRIVLGVSYFMVETSSFCHACCESSRAIDSKLQTFWMNVISQRLNRAEVPAEIGARDNPSAIVPFVETPPLRQKSILIHVVTVTSCDLCLYFFQFSCYNHTQYECQESNGSTVSNAI